MITALASEINSIFDLMVLWGDMAMALRHPSHFALLAAIGLAGCAITEPVVVIGKNGDIMKGEANATLSGGTFKASGKVGGKPLTCSGSYDSLDQSPTITMPVLCSDGRKGFVVATRQMNGLDGFGKVHLNDGLEADFVFGKAALAF